MYCRPAKYCFYQPLSTMYPYPHRWCNLVVYTAVALQINQSLICNIIYKPAYFISMGFYYYFKGCIRINDTNGCTIWVYKMLLYKGLHIIKPHSLSTTFKTYWRRVVDIIS